MNDKLKNLRADTRPTKKVIQGLTKDISTEACIFDLIDNSIDAFKNGETNCLLESYRDCTIKIEINNKRLSIKDEGVGITREKLETSALRFGAVSSHGISIGVFGVGLNRALFKLGKEFKITTETTAERISVTLNADQYFDNDDWDIPISTETQIRKTGTLIEFNRLTDEASAEFSSSSWNEKFLSQLEKRYEIFLIKGLCIEVNKKNIGHRKIEIREADFKILSETFEHDGVKIEIEAGQHHLHRFAYEDKNSENNNKPLTQDYGWVVYCNDRAVLFSDTTQQTGYEGGLHSQYYGFVGKVTFVGDSQKLPWNTTKTGVDLNNKAYLKALEKMKAFYINWKSHTTAVKKGKFDPSPQIPLMGQKPTATPAPTTPPMSGTNQNGATGFNNPKPATPTNNPAPPTYNIPVHPLAQEYLFGKTATARLDFKIPSSEKKLSAVVQEISGLKLAGNPFAIALLLRVLVELSLKSFQARNNNNPQLPNNLSLREKVERCTDYMNNKNLFPDPHEIDAIKSLCGKRGDDIINIEYLQTTIHSSFALLSADGLLAFWINIHPFIRACFFGVK